MPHTKMQSRLKFDEMQIICEKNVKNWKNAEDTLIGPINLSRRNEIRAFYEISVCTTPFKKMF